MDERQLEKLLRQIGKECFVTFFKELNDSRLSNQEVAKQIADEWSRDYSAALTRRVNPARRIIKAGKAKDALINCSKSERLPIHIRDKAARLASI